MPATTTRRFWVALHRYLGLATLVFLFVAAATGCVLCFRAPLDAALNADLFERSPSQVTVDPVAAVQALEARRPDLRVLSFPVQIAPDANLPVSVGWAMPIHDLGYDQIFLSGADGHVVGVRATRPGWDRRHLMQGVYVFHYTLLAGVPGRWIMGLAAFGWLTGALAGVYLTFPSRGPFLRNWLRSWTFTTGSRLGRLLLDLHQASGLWLLIGVLVMAFTSVSLNFFDELVSPAVAAISPPRPSPFDRPTVSASAPERRIGFAPVLSAAVERAGDRGLGWRPAVLDYHPDRNLYGVTFTRTGVIGYRGLGPVSYLFDASDGRFVYEDNPYQDSAGRKLTRALYPLHTGKVAGGVGVVVVLVLGLATMEMCVTGAYVWWTRRGARIAARKAAGQPTKALT